MRHAVGDLNRMPAAVKLLILMGDGFPNDVDYKQDYAIEDTRRSVLEARSMGVFVHGITVNIAGDPRLDELYGKTQHTVISDVGELPYRLWRIYSQLTH